jgi:hypothetical protein
MDGGVLVGFPVRLEDGPWYVTDRHPTWYPGYDEHPQGAEDVNKESMGNGDQGKRLLAPFAGIVLDATDYGRPYGIIIAILALRSIELEGDAVTSFYRHCQATYVKRGQVLTLGQEVGEVGTGGGEYSAHLHWQVCIGKIPGALVSWKDHSYNWVRPTDWLIKHGLSRELVEHFREYDGK